MVSNRATGQPGCTRNRHNPTTAHGRPPITDTTLDPHEAANVLLRWGIRIDPAQVSPGSGTANASAIVSLPDRRLFLKRRNPRYSDLDWVQFDHALLRHFLAAELPVPQALQADDGRPWVEADSSVYELFRYVEGNAHDPGNLQQLRAAGEALGQWHLAAASFDPPTSKQWPRYHSPEDSVEGLHKVLDDSTNCPSSHDREPLERALGIAIDLTERLPDASYWSLPRTIVHGDYHPANLKFRGGSLVGIFDIDWATDQPRMVDLADGLLFFGAVRSEPIVAGDIWSLTDSFSLDERRLAEFAKAYGEVVPPRPDELSALPDLMRCRWLYCRVDAAVRKVEPEHRAEFIARDLFEPLYEIDRIERDLKSTALFNANS